MKIKQTNNKLYTLILMMWVTVILLPASSSLLYFESQGIYGYQFDTEQAITYSMMPDEAMQKPSLGFDWLQRISNGKQDIGVAALQFRLSYNKGQAMLIEPQLYNAWLKYKSGWGDMSIGHLKPASGLSYTLDNHSALLPDMSMYRFTYDRDWGGLYSRDTAWGNLSASFTTASGMNLFEKDGNYLAALHASYGVLSEENYSLGATLQKGDVLAAMGYHFHKIPGTDNPKLHPMTLGGLDGQYRYNNLETALDVYAGKFLDQTAWSILWRNGINLLPEEKIKLEAQGIWRQFEGADYTDYSASVSYKLTPDLALRAMYDRQDVENGKPVSKVIGQIYYYSQLF